MQSTGKEKNENAVRFTSMQSKSGRSHMGNEQLHWVGWNSLSSSNNEAITFQSESVSIPIAIDWIKFLFGKLITDA